MTVHGKGTLVLVDGADLSSYLNEASMSGKAQALDSTTYGHNSNVFSPGLLTGTVNLKGFFDSTLLVGYDIVLSSSLGRTTDAIASIGWEGSFAIGKRVTVMHGVTTDYATTAPVANIVSATASFQTSDGCNTGVSLLDYATTLNTIAANQLFTGVNDRGALTGVQTSRGALAVVQLTAISGTGTPTLSTVTIQHSDDNSTYADLASFTGGLTATGAQSLVIAPGTAINRFVRVKLTTTGSTISANASVGFVRL